MVDNILLCAELPDLMDEEEAFRRRRDPEILAKLAEHDAALAGEEGSLL